jgi:hypothetical protein
MAICHRGGEILVRYGDRPNRLGTRGRKLTDGLDDWRKIGPCICEQDIDAEFCEPLNKRFGAALLQICAHGHPLRVEIKRGADAAMRVLPSDAWRQNRLGARLVTAENFVY